MKLCFKLNILTFEVNVRKWNWDGWEELKKNCFIIVCESKQKPSQYKGVTYDKHSGKWNAQITPKGQKQKYGGSFNDELDAAKRVNQLCEELEIPLLNPDISAIPNQQHQVTKNCFCLMPLWENQKYEIYFFHFFLNIFFLVN